MYAALWTGGIAVSVGGLVAVVLIDVASFLISAALQYTLRTRARPPASCRRYACTQAG
ncbi:hypothetical protein [Nonomuraea basaltis]|uniref:hypothetical protein n=1 Tax=Nonomuraea basaltis TaxID=2495887 RepID=UPI0014863C8A|nr:hypothetical protein [Nonomuraea basaltis]